MNNLITLYVYTVNQLQACGVQATNTLQNMQDNYKLRMQK
jgi:hypothetical protein